MSRLAQSLAERIKEKVSTISVIGLGYVGLNISIAFAEKGFQVHGFDIDVGKVQKLQNGQNYIEEERRLSEVIPRVLGGLFHPSEDVDRASLLGDVIIIIVPTADGDVPTSDYLEKALRSVASNDIRGKLIVIESTVKVGTTEEFARPLLEADGLIAGKDFFLAYSPERIDPGNINMVFSRIPKVVGGIGRESAELAAMLYDQVVDEVMVVSNTRTAEFVKLMENTQRDTNIALMNLFALMCEKADIDIEEAIFAASTKWNFHVYKPGCGVGGHCLKKDPILLMQSFLGTDIDLGLIESARKTNDLMPVITAKKVGWICKNELGLEPGKIRVGILGMAYKANSSDIRNSPSQFIMEQLRQMGFAEVLIHDPYVDHFNPQSELEEVLSCEIVVYTVDHDAFQGVLDDFDGYVIDGTNTLDPSAKVFGIGRASLEASRHLEEKIEEENCEVEQKAAALRGG